MFACYLVEAEGEDSLVAAPTPKYRQRLVIECDRYVEGVCPGHTGIRCLARHEIQGRNFAGQPRCNRRGMARYDRHACERPNKRQKYETYHANPLNHGTQSIVPT